MCIHCAKKADRIREGLETDRYRCTACGRAFLMYFGTEPAVAPCWPPDTEMLMQARAAILRRAHQSRDTA
jgi:hypothetical protein